MQRLVSLARDHAVGLLGFVLAGLALIEAVGQPHSRSAAILAPLASLSLVACGRFPFGAPALTLAFLAGLSILNGPAVEDMTAPFFTVLLTAWAIAAFNDRRHAIAGLFLLVATLALVTSQFEEQHIGDYVWITFFVSALWLAGFVLNRRSEQGRLLAERARLAEEARAEEALRAVAEERAHIARELHDVVGHSVSVMTVQASAVRRLLLPEQEKEREALLTVEQTGREALAEMRRMVGVLRRPEEAPALAPQPSLEHLDKLVAQTREAGLPVALRIEGEPKTLPGGADLTAYRLVQEGLTNTLKHARASHAEVVVRYGDAEVEVVVSDDGDGGGNGAGGGHGLVGMRERVSVYGGELRAGERPSGGYELRATLPIKAT